MFATMETLQYFSDCTCTANFQGSSCNFGKIGLQYQNVLVVCKMDFKSEVSQNLWCLIKSFAPLQINLQDAKSSWSKKEKILRPMRCNPGFWSISSKFEWVSYSAWKKLNFSFNPLRILLTNCPMTFLLNLRHETERLHRRTFWGDYWPRCYSFTRC